MNADTYASIPKPVPPKCAMTCSRSRPVILLKKTDPIIMVVAMEIVLPNLGSEFFSEGIGLLFFETETFSLWVIV